jgi:hypothetical protein
MLRRTAFLVAFALVSLVGVLAPRRAFAQSVSFPSSGLQQPTRVLPNGSNIGVGPRSINLTPLGISYADCIANQTLNFALVVSGFDGQNLQAWVSTGSDCTVDANRGVGQVPVCWLVSTGYTGLVAETQTSITINARVQDIVGHQQSPPAQPAYVPVGAAGCSQQPSFTAVPLTIYFVPLVSNTFVSGSTPMNYVLNTDMVGPPAPLGVTTASGETLIVAQWTANSDSDTVGYDVYIDPPPGSTQQVGGLVCREAGTSTSTSTEEEGGIEDASQDGDALSATAAVSVALDAEEDDGAIGEASTPATDATVLLDAAGDAIASFDATLADAATEVSDASTSDAPSADGSGTGATCYYSYGGGLGSMTTGSCNDPNIGGGNVLDASAAAIALEDEDADLDAELGTSAESSAGGISTVDPKYLIPYNSNVGMLVSSKTQGSYTIKGLTDNVVYAVGVSAVDAYGNIGPPSNPQWCDYPAPVNDFWELYREGGGQAGGLCALEAVGAPVSSTVAFGAAGALCIGLVRRRRRRR